MRHDDISIPSVLLDVVEAILLSFIYVMITPSVLLRCPLRFNRLASLAISLTPQALLGQAMRSALDARTGRTDRAAAGFEGIIGALEECAAKGLVRRHRRAALEELYGAACRSYLRGGHIDDCAQAIIRANKSLSIERVPGLADFDIRCAHIVKAGIAAGRLLGENGLATLMVTAETHIKGDTAKTVKSVRARKPVRLNKPAAPSGEAKIIPFPPLSERT